LDARHVPALLEETLAFLAPERGGWFVDATLGLGGHAAALLERAPGARLLGVDRDPQALALAAARLAPFGDRVRLVRGEFRRLGELAREIAPLAGVLADLGVSSLQLDTAERGFSFRLDGPLDMRMGGEGPTAADVVNTYSEADLTTIFREYGDEPQARRVAQGIVDARKFLPFRTTGELARAVRDAKTRGHERDMKIDPATRVFQALRIEVNQELEGLVELIAQAVDLLERDGRLVVISYHSGEDRIVKNKIRDLARGEVDLATGRTRSESRVLEVLTRKPVRPQPEEIVANPRARSARLRAARRL
jgi:16S rRNA (cytosine1402-N4)-methyltransferase